MIDIHSHILPGMDQGPETLVETLELARMAERQGIQTIVATPRHQIGILHNERNAIIGAVDYVNAKLREHELQVEILPGQEIFLYEDIVADLENGLLLPLGETTGYVLVALPPNHVPPYLSRVVYDMQMAGYRPVLAHPESNKPLRENPNILYELILNGAFAEVSAEHAAGESGRQLQKWVMKLLDAGLAHFVGSGSRDTKQHKPRLQQAYEAIAAQLDETTTKMIQENSSLLIQGNMVNRNAPTRVRRKKYFLF